LICAHFFFLDPVHFVVSFRGPKKYFDHPNSTPFFKIYRLFWRFSDPRLVDFWSILGRFWRIPGHFCDFEKRALSFGSLSVLDPPLLGRFWPPFRVVFTPPFWGGFWPPFWVVFDPPFWGGFWPPFWVDFTPPFLIEKPIQNRIENNRLFEPFWKLSIF